MNINLFVLSLLSLFGIGCATRPPFVPATDCATLTYCGQCASRGGCGFCAGRCMAIGQGSCSAPESLCTTPDRCPPPPQRPLAKTESSGDEKHKTVYQALARAFPQATLTPNLVDKVVRFLIYREHGQGSLSTSGPNQDGTGREVDPFARRVEAKEHPLYLGDAIHYRAKSMPPAAAPFVSEFMMTLPMVRVVLPDRLEKANRNIATVVGDVDLSQDHLLGSVELIADKYAGPQYLGYRPARVELVTPARFKNARFGAIAVYLGYRNAEDRAPSFYLLEAGTATGEPKMIYFSPDMKPIPEVTSYYLPSPFAAMSNTYSGGITMQPAPHENEPWRLVVNSFAEGSKTPYVTVNVNYRRVPWLELPAPIALTGDAGARIAHIAKAMGLPSVMELENVLAKLGRNLHWMESPRYESPAQSKP